MKTIKVITIISRIIVGLVLIFSGFVKGVDPVGSMIKISDYLMAFNWEFFKPFALATGIGLNALEFILGVALVFGSRIRLVSWITLILMGVFTVQTLVLAIWNPVTDCGCFGDAIKLTNWQTFYKNIVIDIFVVVIFVFRKSIKPLIDGKFKEWIPIIGGASIILLFTVYCYLYLPIIDFRPYKVGVDIKEKMTVPEGAPVDEYETILIYKNKETGKQKEFGIENIPDQEIWEWFETKNLLVKEGVKPEIFDFQIQDLEGNEITEQFLMEEGYRLLIVYHNLESTHLNAQQKVNELVKDVGVDGEVKVWGLTSSLPLDIEEFKKNNNVNYSFYNVDVIPLETMIRTNPGIILLKNNVILKKWSSRCIPDKEQVMELLYK